MCYGSCRLRVIIADDHHLIREGLSKTLSENWADIVIHEAANGQGVLKLVSRSNNYQLILLDLFMPDSKGFGILKTLCDHHPDIPVIILSASEDKKHIRRALDFGAAGFVPKSTPPAVMVNAIKLVLSGGIYLPQNIVQRSNESGIEVQIDACNNQNGKLNDSLTKRQREVLNLLALGKQNKEIANFYGISENTVKLHVSAVFRALGVTNRTQAVLVAQKNEFE